MNNQWIRRISLQVISGTEAIELGEFRIRFNVQNADNESPNNAAIRVYNLSQQTVHKLTKDGEFSTVILQAGYNSSDSGFGSIFSGSIKQFKIGKENAVDTYLDIFASDGDIFYTQATVNASLTAGKTPADLIKTVAATANTGAEQTKMITDPLKAIDPAHVPLIRGAVLFGMARAHMRQLSETLGCTWSIQDGKITLIEKTGYLPGQIVKINVATGLVGIPEQTNGGISIKCLLNPKINVGELVELNNSEINQLMQQNSKAAPVPYNQWTGFQYNTPLSSDGLYRVYVVEHEGDTRGNEWYSNLICLAVNKSSAKPVAGV